MTLDQETRQLILRDYREVQEKIARLLDDSSENYRIDGASENRNSEPKYIRPLVVEGLVVPLDHESGELMYQVRNRRALESALMTGRIPQELRPQRAPEYIDRLVVWKTFVWAL